MEEIETDKLVWQKRIMIILIVALTCLFAVLDFVFSSVPGWPLISLTLDTLSFVFCVLLWCSADAKLQEFEFSWGLRLGIFLLPIVGFPVYAFRSRGSDGWRLTGLSILFFAALLGLSYLVDWLTFTLMEQFRN